MAKAFSTYHVPSETPCSLLRVLSFILGQHFQAKNVVKGGVHSNILRPHQALAAGELEGGKKPSQPEHYRKFQIENAPKRDGMKFITEDIGKIIYFMRSVYIKMRKN